MKRAFTTREKVMLLVLTVLLIVIAYFKLILEPINNFTTSTTSTIMTAVPIESVMTLWECDSRFARLTVLLVGYFRACGARREIRCT